MAGWLAVVTGQSQFHVICRRVVDGLTTGRVTIDVVCHLVPEYMGIAGIKWDPVITA